ncbi:hypothetical protein [Stigmatella aurantiaca]|uniref:Conserved uncharacterized protein n=1 Tax=Stigmatella aurantiaca (strain DW4/3-1) TaxID=378806 RepID=Q08UM1_STIAD|nr:hypothetical protein [Stigmatella aurantiaca]ADO68957.1 conserved uncharacterized protein [Stigmatella aurantiaca DW4/3-1]EAU64188.1 hypothetical protein STIAU_8738 [Stigmatella aurantiaca DW4/3-1]
MRTHTQVGLTLLSLGMVLLPLTEAQAQAQQVKVQVEVVLASNKGDAVEPPELEKMKELFRKQNFSFTSFKRLSIDTVAVEAQKATEIRLPNGVNASLKLLALKDGTATVHVDIPRQSAMDVELGRQGSVYQKAGRHVGGELILVLSPPTQ